MNKLWYGDNITIMQNMPKHSVDLIYLDPPFKSDTNYNLLYRNMTGKPVPEQAEAFFDTWTLDAHKLEIAKAMPILMREHGVDDYYGEFWRLWMNALRHTQPELMAYLIYMVQRLLYMKSILRPTGSIYLHCDPAASHYIKVMMDAIFGHQHFKNEIVWKRTTAKSDFAQGAKNWPRVHDSILVYSGGSPKISTFDQPFSAHSADYVTAKYNKVDAHGRHYMLDNLTAPGAGSRGHPEYELMGVTRFWRYGREKMSRLVAEGRVVQPSPGAVPRYVRYLDEMKGVPIGDVWTDIDAVNSQAKERLGYPTQKPVALLDRIICASSNKNDVVFDPFCGCGTTIYSAIKNDRQWIGCDIAILSIKLIREQLSGERFRLVEGHHFEVDGIPTSVEGAQELFKRDPFQFQHWVVERIGGFPMQKKTADRGIDGRVYFETREGLEEVILSVKGGKLRPTDVRDLRGVMEREGSAMAGFLSLQEPSKKMREEAAEAGMYEYGGVTYPRMQLLTVGDILEGKRDFHMPTKMGSRVSSPQHSLPL